MSYINTMIFWIDNSIIVDVSASRTKGNNTHIAYTSNGIVSYNGVVVWIGEFTSNVKTKTSTTDVVVFDYTICGVEDNYT